MKIIKNKVRVTFIVALSSLFLVTSCNKSLEELESKSEAPSSIAQAIAANPNWSIFNAALIRTGIANSLNDTASNFTVFVPDDNAMALSGLSLATINALPIANLTALVQYHIIGSRVPSSLFAAPFPNVRIPTTMALDPSNPLVRMSSFPSKLTAFSYVNSTPVTVIDQVFNNGIIHNTATVLSPTTSPLKSLIAAKPTLSYFRAAIARADSGSTGLSKLDSLLNYAPLNMTVLAPNDAAFQTLVYGLVYSQTLTATGGNIAIATATANGAVAAGPAFLNTNNVSTLQMKGIVAYHFLATLTPAGYQPNIRVFSVNVPTTATFLKTLVNGSFPTHPGVSASAIYTGPIASTVTFSGAGTFPPGGAPFSQPATVIDKDNHGYNGVFHIIDRVLLPQ